MSRNVFIPILLALLVIGTYLPVRNHDFVNYDDPDYVTGNAHVQQGLTQKSVAWAFGNLHGEKTYWHPLTWLSHMLDVEMFGLKAGGHHLTNVFWHTLNVLLLFWLLLKLTGKPWCSAVVAALFAVHPLQVDTVAWITERKNLLSTFFLFLATLAYLRYAARPSIGRNAVVFLLFALGLMTKPAIVTLPCLLLVLDFWPLRRTQQAVADGSESATSPAYAPATWKQLVIEKLPLFALSAASSYITVAGHSGLGLVQQGAQVSIIYRIENAIVSYVRYIGKTVWPSDLSVLYPHPLAWPRWQVIACGALLLLLTDQVLRHKRRQPYLMTGWLWFLGMLVPMIGIVQVGAQAIADRFMYVPIIGLLMLSVWLVADLLERVPSRVGPGVAGATAIIACVIASTMQLQHWRNSVTLMEHTLAALKAPHYIPHHNLGVVYTEQGKLDKAQHHLQQALKLNTNALTLYAIGHVAELERRTNDALAIYLDAARIDPSYTVPQKRAVMLLTEAGQTNVALPLCAELLRRTPQDPDVQFEAGMLLESQNVEQAMLHYLEAMKLNRAFAPAMINLAWILSTHPRQEIRSGPEALDVAKRACILTQWKHSKAITTLAAANAETGNYQEALRLAQQALEMTKTAGGSTARLEKMIKEFQAGRPYREG